MPLLYRCCTVAALRHHPALRERDFVFRFGSGPGIRTLNLAVNRSLQPVQNYCYEFAECRRVPRFATVYRRRCCTKCSRRPTSCMASCLCTTPVRMPHSSRRRSIARHRGRMQAANRSQCYASLSATLRLLGGLARSHRPEGEICLQASPRKRRRAGGPVRHRPGGPCGRARQRVTCGGIFGFPLGPNPYQPDHLSARSFAPS